MARYIPPHPKKGSAEAKAWGARMRALRKKKNPGAAWHETEAMSAAEQAARVTPGSRAASFYIGKRAAHTESAIESRARGMNPRRPHGTFRSCARQVKKSMKQHDRAGDPKKICGAALNPTGRWYWGKLRSMKGSAAAFYGERKPTQESHGKIFATVTGPFSSRQQAEDNIRYFGWKLERESVNPCRTKKNPIAIYNKPRVIYGKCLALYAQKTSGEYAGQRFKHTFKNPVVVIGNPDGSVLLKSTVGKKLWGA